MKRMSKRSSQRNVSAFSIPKRLHPISRCTWVDKRICMFFVYEDLHPLTTCQGSNCCWLYAEEHTNKFVQLIERFIFIGNPSRVWKLRARLDWITFQASSFVSFLPVKK